MDKKLQRQLVQLDKDPAGFRELELCVKAARHVRHIMHEYNLTDEQTAEILKVKVEDLPAIRTGAYPYDLRLIARIEAEHTRLAKESVEVEEVFTVAEGEEKKD